MMPFTYRCTGQLWYSLWMERRKLQLSLRGIQGQCNDIFKKVWHLPKYIYRCPRLFSLKDKLAGKLKQPAQNNCGWLHRQHDLSSDGNNTKKTICINSSTCQKYFFTASSLSHLHLCNIGTILTPQASHFNTDVVNRAGFSKLFMGHSDKMWARGKARITFVIFTRPKILLRCSTKLEERSKA